MFPQQAKMELNLFHTAEDRRAHMHTTLHRALMWALVCGMKERRRQEEQEKDKMDLRPKLSGVFSRFFFENDNSSSK